MKTLYVHMHSHARQPMTSLISNFLRFGYLLQRHATTFGLNVKRHLQTSRDEY